jgi:hypothetical protein
VFSAHNHHHHHHHMNSISLDFIRTRIKSRQWEESNLPLSQSRIAFDLSLFIGSCYLSKTKLTHKLLFNSLNYSERGIRNVLDQFVTGEWCSIVVNDTDKRCHLVVATQKLMTALSAYEQTFTPLDGDVFDGVVQLGLE